MAAINQTNELIQQADSSFIFKLFQPEGRLSAYVQGVWSASVSPEDPGSIKRWLQGDACSGILFNLKGPIYLDKIQYSAKVLLLSVSKQAHSITLPAGSQLAGIRFQPGISFGIFKTHCDKPIALKEGALSLELQAIVNRLVNTPDHYARISALYRWANRITNFSDMIPTSLSHALNIVQKTQALGPLNGDVLVSQRQLERQFQKWMDMTPKQYQRILRVKRALNFLKQAPDADLVALALDNGFSDQAHMTREFKQIAKITPKKYSKLVVCRQN